MLVNKEIKIIRELLNLTQKKLAEELGVSVDSIIRWENGTVEIEERNLDLIYKLAHKNGIFFNKIYEQILFEECQKNNLLLLFHGSKKHITFPLDLLHSKEKNDFGIGFYLGDNFEQSAVYISNCLSNNIYAFSLNTNKLKIIKFSCDTEWMIAIAYYRGWLSKYENHQIVKAIIEKIENSDIVIAPIADNRMFDLISEFVDGFITNEQCEHALAATNLGYQYVVRTNNALKKLKFIKLFYLSNVEKTEFILKKDENNDISYNKVRLARIEYRNKGKYIEELLK